MSSPKEGSGRDLTVGSISSTLFKLAIPIILTNIMHVIYNLTDTFWLGKLEEDATNAVAVTGNAGNLVWFISALAGGFMAAASALIAQYTGAGKSDKIKSVIGQLFIIVALCISFFLLLTFTGLRPFLELLDTPAEIIDATTAYLRIIMPGLCSMFFFGLYQSISHGRGDSVTPMKVQIIGVVTNVVLDPFLIFGWWGMPKMGIVGAAWATLFARIITIICATYCLRRYYRDVLPSRNELKPDWKLLKKIVSIAVPQSITQAMTSLGFLMLVRFVNHYGTAVVSVYQISNQLIGLFLIPAMGINNALGSYIGQNIGARKVDRAVEGLNISMKYVLLIMGVGTVILFFYGGEVTRLFINEPEVVEMSRPMFKIMATSAWICSAFFIWMSAFSGTGHTKQLMHVNIARLWCFRLPLTYLLSGYLLQFVTSDHFSFGFLTFISQPLKEKPYEALWWASFCSNVATFFWTWLLYKKGEWKEPVIEN